MLEKHAAFREELSQIQSFVAVVAALRDQTSPAGASKTSPHDHVLQHVAVAFEDMPPDMREAARVLLMHPGDDKSLRDRVTDVAKNAAGGGWGELESVTGGDIDEVVGRLTCLHMLAMLNIVAPYTYRVDAKVIRGSRPTPDKLRALFAGGCLATINLCKEMPHGDDELIAAAGLTGQMKTGHVTITDNTPPSPAQVIEFLALVASLPGQVYVHCEAGMGRTGVMVACYRLSQGWTLANALLEAAHFGCAIPDQLAFIEIQAVSALAGDPPAAEVLAQTALMNSDPLGLERALGLDRPVSPAPLSPDSAGG